MSKPLQSMVAARCRQRFGKRIRLTPGYFVMDAQKGRAVMYATMRDAQGRLVRDPKTRSKSVFAGFLRKGDKWSLQWVSYSPVEAERIENRLGYGYLTPE